MNEMASGSGYSIGDLASLYGVSLRTLRFYEERELLRPHREGRRRIYTETDRMRLEAILKAKHLGFSLSAIWNFVEGRSPEAKSESSMIDLLGLSAAEIAAQIERLQGEHDRVVAAIEELQSITTGQARLVADRDDNAMSVGDGSRLRLRPEDRP